MPELEISGNPTDEEAAICLAAITFILANEKTSLDSSCSDSETAPQDTGWGRAARLAITRHALEGLSTRSQKLWGLTSRSKHFIHLLLAASALCATGIFALPTQALERIDATAGTAICGSRDFSVPSGDRSESPKPKSSILRVALAAGSNQAAILSFPDGATLCDVRSGDLLAQMPPRSSWDVRMQTSPDSCLYLTFSGTVGNYAFNRVVVDRSVSSTSPYRSAAFQRNTDSGFQPVLLDAGRPEFALNLRKTAKSPRPAFPTYRSIGFSSEEPSGLPVVEQPRTFLIKPLRPDGLVGVGSKLYRGCIELQLTADQMRVVNVVDLEDYLLSVVPAEMPGSWSVEALKAQAIAARSYAVANLGKHSKEGYDLVATVADQVYAGVERETDNSNRAVAETRGLVLKHQDKVVSAFFHSAGGGCTELAEHVWGKPVPYLKSVTDFDHSSPHFEWTRPFKFSEAEECLKKSGKDPGQLLSILPLVRTSSGRLKQAMLIGTSTPVIVSGEELRKIFSLPSSLFNACVDNDCYVFAGRGFGHGLGMSQWGAKSLAEQGYNAAQILSYYYKDVSIDQM